MAAKEQRQTPTPIRARAEEAPEVGGSAGPGNQAALERLRAPSAAGADLDEAGGEEESLLATTEDVARVGSADLPSDGGAPDPSAGATRAPAAPPAPPPGGDGLPFRAQMEAAFGEDFSDVEVEYGGLGPLNANALATDDKVTFATRDPDPEVVGEELAHLVQKRRHGDTGEDGQVVSSPGDPAEIEARAAGVRAAAGQPAGPLTQAAAPAARDAAGPAPKPQSKKLKGETWTVWPDAVAAFLPTLMMPRTVTETQFQALVDEAGRELFDAVSAIDTTGVALLGDGPARVKQLIAAADPIVLKAAYRYLAEAGATLKVDLARRLADELDPVRRLKDIVDSGTPKEEKLAAIRQWAVGFGPDLCRMALADGDFQVRLNAVFGNQSVLARIYLINAGVEDRSPRTLMFEAMYAKKSEEFLVAWEQLKATDPHAAHGYLSDGTFVADVRTFAKDAVPQILKDMASFEPEAIAAEPDALTGAAAFNAAALREGLEAFSDGVAARIGQALWSVQGTIFGDEDEPRAVAFFELATREIRGLRREAAKLSGADPATAEGQQAVLAAEAEALRIAKPKLPLHLINGLFSFVDHSPASKQFFDMIDERPGQLGKRMLQDAGLTTLTTEELARIEPMIVATTAQLGDGSRPTAQVIAAHRRFVDGVEAVIPKTPMDPRADWCAHERRRHAHRLLGERVRATHGVTLSMLLEIGRLGGYGDGSGVEAHAEANAEKEIAADPNDYGGELTPDDRAHLEPVFEEYGKLLAPIIEAKDKNHPGLELRMAKYQAKLLPKRGWIQEQIVDLKYAIRPILEPVRKEGRFLALHHQKVRLAMSEFDRWFEARYGSLKRALDEGAGDEAKSLDVETMLGRREDATAGLADEALSGVAGDGRLADAFLVPWRIRMDGLAGRLAKALRGAMAMKKDEQTGPMGGFRVSAAKQYDDAVNDADVLALSDQFVALRDQYVREMPGAKVGDPTKFLVTAFAPLGGHPAPLIAKGLGSAAPRAIANFGLRYGDMAAVEDQLVQGMGAFGAASVTGESQADFNARVNGPCQRTSRALASLGGLKGTARAKRLGEVDRAAQGLVGLARGVENGTKMLGAAYAEATGIDLGVDLGMHLRGDEIAPVARLFGIDPGTIPVREEANDSWFEERREHREASGEHANDPFAYLRNFGVTPEQVAPDFTEQIAFERAYELHRAAARLPASHKEILGLVTRRPGENTVVLGLFKKQFGYDLKYRLREVMPDDAESVDRYDDLAKTSGTGGPGGQLVAYARTKDRNEVLRQALRLGPDEKKAILADPRALGDLRAALENKEYERLYRTLTGKLTLYEIVSDDKDTSAHIEEYFTGKRKEILASADVQALAKQDPEKAAALVQQRLMMEGRREYADPAMQKVLKDRFDGKKDFEISARILGAGQMSGGDAATRAVIEESDTDEKTLIAATGTMTPEEKERRQNDPFFQRRIASDLEEQDQTDQQTRRQFFSDLYSEPGEAGAGKVEASYGIASWAGVTLIDAPKAMAAVLAMSRDEFGRWRQDAEAVQRLRSALDAGRRERLDELLDAGVAKEGGSPADRARELNVARYVAKFLDDRGSTKKALQTAQEAFNEPRTAKLPKADGSGEEEVEVFGKAQRTAVWFQVARPLDIREDAYDAVWACLINDVDPAATRLAIGFDGSDNQAEILAAIDNAGATLVIEGWSNVKQPGPTAAYGSLTSKFAAYVSARNAHQMTVGQDQAGAVAPDAVKRSEEQYLAARNAFWDHRLDLSTETMSYFEDGGGDIKRLQFGFPGGKDAPSKKRLLEMKDHVRKRIWALTSDEVAAKLGLVEPEPPKASGDAAKDEEGKAAFEQQKAQHEQDKGALMSADRVTRSEKQQRDDAFRHERGSGSGSGAETEGKRVDVANQVYNAEIANDLEDSKLSADEIERIKKFGADFDRKVQEYKEAKAKLGTLIKFIVRALIVAVALALTGPGAMGLLATLVVAGTSAMADNVVDSIVLGNDFDWEEDGVKHLLTEVGTAAFTFGIGKAFQAGLPALGLAGKFEKIKGFEKGLAEGAKSSFKGAALNYAYMSGKSVVTAPLATLSESVVAIIDPSEMKYGAGDYGDFAADTFQEKFDQLPGNLRDQLLENLASSLVTLGRGKLAGSKPPTLPGVDMPDLPTPRNRSLLAAAGRHLATDALPDALADFTEAGLTQFAKKIVADGPAAGFDWSLDEVVTILKGVAAKRAAGLGGAVGTHRKGNFVEDRIAEHKASSDWPGHADPTFELHYRAYLDGVAMGFKGLVEDDPKKFEARLGAIKKKVDAQAANQPHGATYRAWVLGEPEGLVGRADTSYDDFAAQLAEGQKHADEILDSKAFGEMKGFEQRHVMDEMRDTGNLLALGRGKYGLDLREEGGAEKFRGALKNTITDYVLASTALVTKDWPEDKKTAYKLRIEALDSNELARLDPHDPDQAQRLSLQVAAAFGREWAKTHP